MRNNRPGLKRATAFFVPVLLGLGGAANLVAPAAATTAVPQYGHWQGTYTYTQSQHTSANGITTNMKFTYTATISALPEQTWSDTYKAFTEYPPATLQKVTFSYNQVSVSGNCRTTDTASNFKYTTGPADAIDLTIWAPGGSGAESNAFDIGYGGQDNYASDIDTIVHSGPTAPPDGCEHSTTTLPGSPVGFSSEAFNLTLPANPEVLIGSYTWPSDGTTVTTASWDLLLVGAADTDHDGVDDYMERLNGTDPLVPNTPSQPTSPTPPTVNPPAGHEYDVGNVCGTTKFAWDDNNSSKFVTKGTTGCIMLMSNAVAQDLIDLAEANDTTVSDVLSEELPSILSGIIKKKVARGNVDEETQRELLITPIINKLWDKLQDKGVEAATGEISQVSETAGEIADMVWTAKNLAGPTAAAEYMKTVLEALSGSVLLNAINNGNCLEYSFGVLNGKTRTNLNAVDTPDDPLALANPYLDTAHVFEPQGSASADKIFESNLACALDERVLIRHNPQLFDGKIFNNPQLIATNVQLPG